MDLTKQTKVKQKNKHFFWSGLTAQGHKSTRASVKSEASVAQAD
jgi:hypothetical protein